MRLAVIAVLSLLGCGVSKPPVAAPTQEEGGIECMPVNYRLMPRGTSMSSGGSNAPAYDAAIDAAEQDIAEANKAAERNDFKRAATHFLACAKRFDSVPKADPLYDSGVAGVLTCYENAALAYANGGLYAKQGKPMLEAAKKAHPELTKQIDAVLADPPTDCATPAKPVAP